jgi:hypothetical protein
MCQNIVGSEEHFFMQNDSGLPADFDPKIYLELHSDVKAARVDPVRHYLVYGRKEGRSYKRKETTPDFVCGGAPNRDHLFHKNPKTKRSTISKHSAIWDWVGSIANKKGFRVLEIGSRAVVSDSLWKKFIPNCEYVGFDVLPGKNVDIVGDAHRLSEYFSPGSFDLVMSFAVFEHLAMPWIVAEEVSKVLDKNGHVCVETHFSFSEHELPWNFFQFHSHALEVLFCRELGFDLIDSGLDNPIVGRFSNQSTEYLRGRYVTDLYCHSSIIAQKTRDSAIGKRKSGGFDWRSVAQRIGTESMYPKR